MIDPPVPCGRVIFLQNKICYAKVRKCGIISSNINMGGYALMKIARVQLANEVTYAVLKDDKVLPIKGLPYEAIELDGREFAAADAR